MSPEELRRLERRAAGGDPRAKRVLRERERAIEAAEDAKRAAEDAERGKLLVGLLEGVVEAELTLPDGTLLRAVEREGVRVAVEADQERAIRVMLAMEALPEDETCQECHDRDCSGCFTEDDARKAWVEAADFASEGPQWRDDAAQRRYGRYALPARWVDACEDEDSLDRLAMFLGREPTTSRGRLYRDMFSGFTLTSHGGVTLVGDGQDTYAVDEEVWDDAVEELILDRQRLEVALPIDEDLDDPGAREREIDERWDWYNRLCQYVQAIGGLLGTHALARAAVRDEGDEGDEGYLTGEQRDALRVLLADVIEEVEGSCPDDCAHCAGRDEPCPTCGYCARACVCDENDEDDEDDEDEQSV